MKQRLFLLACLVCYTVQSVSAWNRTAHEAIAYIAEQHLTPSAKAAIEKYLDGRSIVYYNSTNTSHSNIQSPSMRTTTPCRPRNAPNWMA